MESIIDQISEIKKMPISVISNIDTDIMTFNVGKGNFSYALTKKGKVKKDSIKYLGSVENDNTYLYFKKMIIPNKENFHLIKNRRNTFILFNGCVIAKYNYSDTIKSYFLYMQNISDVIEECLNEDHCLVFAQNKFNEWINGI